MTTGSPQQAEAPQRRGGRSREDRREDLLVAAERVFLDRGVAAATVADITGAAQVAKGTFYLYFASKDHVLAALHQRFVEGFVERATRLFRDVGDEDWWVLADRLVARLIDYDFEHRQLHRVVHESIGPHVEELYAEHERQVKDLIVGAVRAGTAAGAFDVLSPAVTADLLYHGIEGAVHHALSRDDGPDRDELVAAAQQLVRRSLSGRVAETDVDLRRQREHTD